MSSLGPLSKEAVVARAPGLLMVEVDGETVLLCIANGSYYGLATTARDIWVRLVAKTKASELCEQIVAAYDGDPARIEVETLEFVGKMAALGLVTVA